jgi:ABC-2 type transport system permease protein
MKTMKWLLRREFWEHKGALLWAPVVVGISMIVLIGGMLMYAATFSGQTVVTVDGQTTTTTTTLSDIFARSSPADQQMMADSISDMYMAAATPLMLMLAVIAFFYCLGALFEERRDRSVLFWKSLPVSDSMTVLSKVATALVLAPLIALAAAVVTSFALLIIACIVAAFHNFNVFGMVLSQSEVYLNPLRLFGLLPVYILWALPTVGWLLLVSAWARSKVFLWAVGAPVLLIFVIKFANWVLNTRMPIDWFAENIVARGLLGLFPGAWIGFAKMNMDQPEVARNAPPTVDAASFFAESWMTLASPSVWIGAIAGVAMLYGAMRLRRWRDEG